MPKYFFKPYKGEQYEDGYRGCKTLVVGAHHYCNHSELPCYRQCVERGDSKHYDKCCPVNQQLIEKYGEQWRDYYDLSNDNILELDCYLDDFPYPAYSAFTKYMLHIPDYVLEEQKRDFWNHVAFYNYVQHYLPCGFTPAYDEANKKMYEDDYDAFEEAVDELRPDIIYVWNPAVKECLCSHGNNLIYKGRTDMQALSVYLFAMKRAYPKSQVIVNEFLQEFPNEGVSTMISTLHHLQLGSYAKGIVKEHERWLARYTWDRDLACYLIKTLITNYKIFNAESREYFIDKIQSELKEMKDVRTIYSTFYWKELEDEINKRGMEMKPCNGCLPPVEWSWFDYPSEQEQIQKSSACLMYLKYESDICGAYVKSLITSERYKILFILCDYANMNSYLHLINTEEHPYGIKYIYQFQAKKNCNNPILVEIEHSYTRHAKLFIADQKIETILLKNEIKSLCPSMYINEPTEAWCKNRIIAFIGKDIKIPLCRKMWFPKKGCSPQIPIKYLSQLMHAFVNAKLLCCTTDGFEKPVDWKNHHYVYLKNWVVALFKPDYVISTKQLIKLFCFKDICKDKAPRRNDAITDAIDDFFRNISENVYNDIKEKIKIKGTE